MLIDYCHLTIFDSNIKRKVQWIISDYEEILFLSEVISSDVNIIKMDSTKKHKIFTAYV